MWPLQGYKSVPKTLIINMSPNMRGLYSVKLLFFAVVLFTSISLSWEHPVKSVSREANLKNGMPSRMRSPRHKFSNTMLYDIDKNVRTLPGDLKPFYYLLKIHPFFDAPGVVYNKSKAFSLPLRW